MYSDQRNSYMAASFTSLSPVVSRNLLRKQHARLCEIAQLRLTTTRYHARPTSEPELLYIAPRLRDICGQVEARKHCRRRALPEAASVPKKSRSHHD